LTTFIASTAERARQRRQLTDKAVRLAMQNQWQEAADVNRQLIELQPEEHDAWNRLGKALSELGQYGAALDAYGEALKREPSNPIAQKQIKRLALLVESEPTGDEGRDKLDPKLLIEETGKTGIFELQSPAAPTVLARIAAGDQVYLKVEGSAIRVEDQRGEVLGNLPARAALRLIELTNGGNKYVAGVTSVTEKHVRVLIRETYQAPALQGRVSFPSKGGPLPPELRAYTKDRAMRFDIDDDDLMADDLDEDAADGDADADETTADIEYYEDSDSSGRE
jgi:hypothetical protein